MPRRAFPLPLLFAGLCLLSIQAVAASRATVAVSPGDTTAAATVDGLCPTFSWGAVDGATGYELALFADDVEAGEASKTPAQVWRRAVRAAATSWTPSGQACLAPGRTYLWTVRALGQDGPEPWAPALAFRTREAPSAAEVERALEVLRHYVAGDDAAPKAAGAAAPHPSSEPGTAPRAAPEILSALLEAGAEPTVAVHGEPADPGSGNPAIGVRGVTPAEDGASSGVHGETAAAGGSGAGVRGIAHGAGATAGVFDNLGGGKVLSGLANSVEVFAVGSDGAVTAVSFTGDGSGLTNLPCSACTTYYRDDDGDGFGDDALAISSTFQPDGYSADPGDCDDADPDVFPGQTEVCNGIDDDCDGEIDEDVGAGTACYTGPAGTSGVGPCHDGVLSCTLGVESCDGEVTPQAEQCNGVDDDCDGTLGDDGEGEPWFGQACDGSDADLCEEGGFQCVGMTQTCSDATGDTMEICNNLDDDCDGQTDENIQQVCYTGPAGTAGVGECKTGTQTCSSGTFGPCIGQVTPVAESCDNKDNDCNGAVDDGNPGGGGSCDTGQLGVCAAGTNHCVGGSIQCQQNVGASPEVCDGLDNDCDGTLADDGTDEPWFSQPCDGADSDLCTEGAFMCTGGSQSCSDATGDTTELCNGLDDDCDGTNDEDFPDLGNPCGTGPCSGFLVCKADGTATECNGDPPSAEVCDGVDNDCDGAVDDGVDCGGVCCGGGEDCCGGACANLQTDPSNCGACANQCNPGDVCNAGICQTP